MVVSRVMVLIWLKYKLKINENPGSKYSYEDLTLSKYYNCDVLRQINGITGIYDTTNDMILEYLRQQNENINKEKYTKKNI